MDGCFYCEDSEKRKSLMIEICQLNYSDIYLNRDQKHKGRIVVKFKSHKTEYFHLTKEENAGFFYELALAAEAVFNLYHPDKINYATFGDGVPHVHVHVVPKYKDGLNWGTPFDDTLPKQYLSDNEYQQMVKEIRSEIQRLFTEK